MWQPIETAPEDDERHIRALWVHRAKTGKRLYWQSDLGSLNENGEFVGEHGDDFGWRASDYTHWMPLPAPPEDT